MTPPPPADWHIDHRVLTAYVEERVDGVAAWSVEAHLPECGTCRARLHSEVETSHLAGQLHRTRLALVSEFERPSAFRRHRVTARAARSPVVRSTLHPMMGRAPWLGAVLVAVVVAVGSDLVFRMFWPSGLGGVTSLILLFGPALPLAGVALTCLRSADPWAEVVLSTPSAGLGMVLRRSLAVLLVALPVTLVLGTATGSVSAWLLLMPTLALTSLTLALGSRTGMEAGALIVGGLWAVLVAAPALVQLTPVVPVYAERAPWWWAALAAVCALIVLARRDDYARLPHLLAPRAGAAS